MRLMAVFPHPDDEIGTAGTLSKHVKRGDQAKLIWLTRGELASQFGDSPPEEVARIREGHGAAVAKIIGAEHAFLDFPDAGLTGGREEALVLAKEFAAWKPDVVFTWDPNDIHPDHRAAYWTVLSALKFCRIPKLVGEPHRGRIRLLHYFREDIQRPAVYVDIAETIDIAEQVFTIYHDFYKWEWTKEMFRANRARLGMVAGAKFAERFQSESFLAWGYLPG